MPFVEERKLVTWPVYRRIKRRRLGEQTEGEDVGQRGERDEGIEDEQEVIQQMLVQDRSSGEESSSDSYYRLDPVDFAPVPAGRSWSASEEEALIAAVREGRSSKYISEHILPNRSVGAIDSRKQRLRSKGVLEKGVRQGAWQGVSLSIFSE